MLVSVIMPVFNAETFVKDAIQGVLNQTLKDFEFLLLNDGSTDRSEDIISSFDDSRIKVINSKENKGLVYQLNLGLSLAKGKYIARFDADDICHPERLEKQVQFLESNPEYGLCGAWMEMMGSSQIIKFPQYHEDIVNKMLSSNPIAHPVVVIRSSTLKKFKLIYEESYWPAEDYKLWASLMFHSKLYNLPLVLLEYRQHEGQISKRKVDLQRLKMVEVEIFQIINLCPELTDNEVNALKSIFYWKVNYDNQSLLKIKELIQKVLEKNKTIGFYDEEVLKNKFSAIWYLICKNSIPFVGLKPLSLYFTSTRDFRSISNFLKLTIFFFISIIKKISFFR